ncbi:MAG: phenylalanine--tRNA ligase subunit beta [Candidatus Sungbacteria bacterium]|nr:phenylalanine--tRNA ligase subunit beta [Candidatus Sungbacteria bacterium]
MKFSYNWLKELAPFKESPEKLAEFLTARVFEVESIEKIGADFTVDIKLPSNRIADASGHIGIAKEIASLKRLRIKTLNHVAKLKEDKKEKAGDYLSVRLEDREMCLRYSARIMGEITVKESPKWLRERLEVCGVQSINNIVDAANYVMLETGQPMHVFDFEKLQGRSKNKKNIVVRIARQGEVMPALDGKTYSLPEGTLVIADEEKPIAIAGIKGGEDTGVSKETSAIILESANFSPAIIRKTSQKLKLRTDASVRFENGLDPNQTVVALDRLAELIEEIAGGVTLHGIIDAYSHREKTKEILFRAAYANSMIGADIEPIFYHNAFLSLGCVVRAKRKDEFIVEPPTIRRDLQIEEDLIEEAARLIGLDAIPPVFPEVTALSPVEEDEILWEKKILQFARAAGFHETVVYEFTGERELGRFFLDSSHTLELENPANPDTRFLLPRALIKYAATTAENLHHFNSVRLFGIAKRFFIPEQRTTKEPNHIEKKDLVFCYAEKNREDAECFYALKGVVDSMLDSLGISEHWYDDAIPLESRKHLALYHPYRMAEIKIGNKKIGTIGELHPEVLKNIKAKTRIAAAEFDFEALVRLARAEHEFIPPSKFPAIVRDIAVNVPETAKTEEVLNIIETAGGALLEDTDLFDYFQDEAMRDSEEKSLAFHLIFQSAERTLKDEEVEELLRSIAKAIEERGWEVRE